MYLIRTVVAAFYRHSRVSGNLDGTEKTSPLLSDRRRIPAYAGMTVGAAGRTVERAETAKSRHPPPKQEMTAKGFLKGNRPVTPPYFRVRRMTFLQVASQVRLCRAAYFQG